MSSRLHSTDAHSPLSLLISWPRHLLLLALLALGLGLTAFIASTRANSGELIRRATILHLRDSLRRDVSLKSASLDPRGQLTLNGLVIKDISPKGTPLLSVKQAVIDFTPGRFSLSPLKALDAVDRVTLQQPQIALARDGKGAWSIDDILKLKQAPSEDRFRGELVIRDGDFHLRDDIGFAGSGPIKEHFSHLNLSTTPGDGRYIPFNITASTTNGRVRAIDVTGGLHMSALRASCDVRLAAVDLAFVKRLLPAMPGVTLDSGTIDGSIQLSAGVDLKNEKSKMRIAVVADLHNVRGTTTALGRSMPWQITSGQLRNSGETLELVNLRGSADGVPLTIDGHVTDFTKPVLTVQVRTEGANVARYAPLVPGLATLPYRWSGRAAGWAQISGPLANPVINAHLSGVDMDTASIGVIRKLSGDMRYAGGMLTLSNVTGQGFGGHLKGKAWISTRDTNDTHDATRVLIKGEATKLPFNELAAGLLPTQRSSLPPIVGEISGPFSLSFKDNGDISLISHCGGSLHYPNWEPAQVDANLSYQYSETDATLTIDSFSAKNPFGLAQISGDLNLASASPKFNLRIDGSKLCLDAIAKTLRAALPQTPEISGNGFLSGQLRGDLSEPSFSGRLRATEGKLRGIPYDDLTGDILATFSSPPHFVVDNVRIISGKSRLELKGSACAGDCPQATGKVTLARSSIEELESLIGIDLPLQGIIEGELTLSSITAKETGQGSLTLRRPALALGDKTIQFDSASVDFDVTRQSIRITNAVLSYRGMPITVSGEISTFPDTPPDRQFSLKISAPALDIDSLTALSTDATDPLWSLTGDARVLVPFDIEGECAVNATIEGTLFDKNDASVAAALLRSLRVSAIIDKGKKLRVAGVPIDDFGASFVYNAAQQSARIDRLIVGRNGDDPYLITLAKPGTIDMDSGEIELHLALRGAEKPVSSPADLGQIHRDLTTVIANTVRDYSSLRRKEADDGPLAMTSDQVLARMAIDEKQPFIASLAGALRNIPTPFQGHGTVAVDIEGGIDKPRIAADFSLHDMLVGGLPIPSLEGEVAYDIAPHTISIQRLIARDTDDTTPADMMIAELEGAIVLPVRSARGEITDHGSLEISCNAQNVTPELLGTWLHRPWLAQQQGKATIVASIESTFTDPRLIASIDVASPVIGGVAFDSLAAIVSVHDDNIIIGNEGRGEAGAATLQFKGADKAPIEPLRIYGSLPFGWDGAMRPTIPSDRPLSVNMRLPKQGFDLVRAYYPALPAGNGSLEASLLISGTPAQPEITNGIFLAHAPELRLPGEDQNLPNRLRDVVLDLSFHSSAADGYQTSVVSVNDLSAVYDHYPRPKRVIDPLPLKWVKSLFGGQTTAFTPPEGAVVSQGSIRLDMRAGRMLTSEGKLRPLGEILNYLNYDLYAKTLRAPLRIGEYYQGSLTSYLHLGNNTDSSRWPLLTGVLYSENARLSVPGKSGGLTSVLPHFPIDPELSLALQIGPNNRFEVETDNALLYNNFFIKIPFMITTASDEAAFPLKPSAIKIADTLAKPPIERENPAYFVNAEHIHDAGGTRAWITGSLSNPVLAGEYELQRRKAQVQMPGGYLALDKGYGQVRFAPLEEDPLLITAQATATGTAEDYRIAARIDTKNLIAELGKSSLLDLQIVSAPPGRELPGQDQLYKQLTGFNDILALLQNQQQDWSAFTYKWIPNRVINPWLDMIARGVGLQTLSFNYDPLRNPEASLVTPEFGVSKWSAFQIRASRTFTATPTWELGLDYRVPEYRWLRNFSISLDLNERNETSINLQYQFPFTTSLGKKKPAKPAKTTAP